MQSSKHNRSQEPAFELEAGAPNVASDTRMRGDSHVPAGDIGDKQAKPEGNIRANSQNLAPSLHASSGFIAFCSSIWPCLLLASFALLIFWHLPGATSYEGDDYLQTKIFPLFKRPTDLDSYMFFIRGRGFLPWSYKAIYLAVGQNFNTAVYGFVGLYLAVTMGFYLTLRRFLSVPAALGGALIFLCHCAKYHAILAYNAQIYSIVIACGLLILNVMISKLPQFAKAVITTLLYWVSIHFYEILMVVVPIFPVLWLGPSLSKRRMPPLSCIVASLLPIIATPIHICLLNPAPPQL